MSQIRLDNLTGQMTLFESAVDGLKLAVGDQLAPVLRNIYEVGTNAFSWATESVEENEWIVGAIAGVAVALGALALDKSTDCKFADNSRSKIGCRSAGSKPGCAGDGGGGRACGGCRNLGIRVAGDGRKPGRA